MQANSGLFSVVWRLLKPGSTEVILQALIVLTLAIVSAYQLATEGKIGNESQDFVASMTDSFASVSAYLNSGDFWARFFLFGFWFIVGTMVYFIFWFVINLIIDTYNDIFIAAAFTHPRSFHQSDYWLSIVGRRAIQGFAGVALVFYTIFWLWVLAPLWLYVLQRLLSGPLLAQEVADGLLFLLGVSLSLHVATVLVRLLRLQVNVAHE